MYPLSINLYEKRPFVVSVHEQVSYVMYVIVELFPRNVVVGKKEKTCNLITVEVVDLNVRSILS